MKNTFCSLVRTFTLTALFLSSPYSLHAQQTTQITGIPIVRDDGTFFINGQHITLWGFDRLAPDQQCWQDGTAWCCGENAMMALRHYVEGHIIQCEPQQPVVNESPIPAKCYREKRNDRYDIAAHLIAKGWGLDNKRVTGGFYGEQERTAKENKNGIWSGRFQSAEDWKDGVQRFIGEDK